jgi:hypothetical protein
MNSRPLPIVTPSLTRVPSRRDVLRALAGAGVGLSITRLPKLAAAKKTRKNTPKKPKPNAFSCLDVGKTCTSAVQCCSGVCEGKKGKRTCRSHNAGICRPEGDFCLGAPQACKLLGERIAVCWQTTGKAAFCGDPGDDGPEGFCRNCKRDTDCQEEFGPGAACIDMRRGICADQGACADTGGTACIAAVV